MLVPVLNVILFTFVFFNFLCILLLGFVIVFFFIIIVLIYNDCIICENLLMTTKSMVKSAWTENIDNSFIIWIPT